MFYSYKNCRLNINGIPYYAKNVSITQKGSIEPSYEIGNIYNSDYVPSDGINGVLNISYPLTGQDELANYISYGESALNINFGGLCINSGYLRQYSFNLSPTSPVVVDAEIVFYNSMTGNITPVYEEVQEFETLNTANASIYTYPGNEVTGINNITKLDYRYSVDIEPGYEIGDTSPIRVVFGPKNIDCNIYNEDAYPIIPVSGENLRLRLKLGHPTNSLVYQNFDINGVLDSKNFNLDNNSILNNFVSIKQNDLNTQLISSNSTIPRPSIYFFSPTSGYYGTNVLVSGNNLNYINYIKMEENIFVSNFIRINNNQINFTVPDNSLSSKLSFYTSGDIITTDDIFIIGDKPITINSISSSIADSKNKILVSGENFYEISRVMFSNTEAAFEVIDNTLIEVEVPQNITSGSISIVSDLLNASGASSDGFAQTPEILGFSPLSGFTGDVLTVSGYGLSTINHVKINNLPISSSAIFSIVGNTGLYVTVPSGNTKGYIGVSGAFDSYVLSTQKFVPYCIITGITPSSGRTGEFIHVSGKNYLPELLYSIGLNQYAVAFNSEKTGYFSLIRNNTVLSGYVPSGAISGKIKIYNTDTSEYPSNFSFLVRDDPPVIDYFVPETGRTGEYISIIGQNLNNIDYVIITGSNTGYNISSSNFTTSVDKSHLSFMLPSQLTGGRYDIRISGLEGASTGSGLYIMRPPTISGLSHTSGTAGLLVTISGLEIYPENTSIYFTDSYRAAYILSGSITYNNNSGQFYVPQGLSSGYYNLSVNNSFSTTATNFLYVPTPHISGFSPISGQWGDLITVSGRYFDLVNSISINSVSVQTFTLTSSTGIKFGIPTGVNSDYIKITNSVGSSFSDNILLITPPLVIFSGFKPIEGYQGSGILISGNYLNTAEEIHISGISGHVSITGFSSVGSTGIYFNVPGGAISGPLKIVNAKGVTPTSSFSIISGAVANLMSSYTGVYGDSIYISGNYLSGSIPFFTSPNGSRVTGNNITRIGDTGLYFSIPKEIISDYITIKGRNDQTIISPLIYYVLPTISGVSGNYSYATGGYISITGINAYEATGCLGISGNNRNIYNLYTINEFSGIYKTGYTEIRAKINNNFAGTGKLFLISSKDASITGGPSGSNSYQNYRNSIVFNNNTTISQPAPTISYFSPTGGISTTTITISGDNLFSANNIIFNVGSTYTLGTINSYANKTLVVNPPTMITGTGLFFVTTPFGTTSSGLFRILQPLYISGYYPLQGHTGDIISISGSGLLNITGVKFGDYNAGFSGGYLNNTYIISGQVPPDFTCCGASVQICVINEGQSYCL